VSIGFRIPQAEVEPLLRLRASFVRGPGRATFDNL
jgi:hypothetical protein